MTRLFNTWRKPSQRRGGEGWLAFSARLHVWAASSVSVSAWSRGGAGAERPLRVCLSPPPSFLALGAQEEVPRQRRGGGAAGAERGLGA